LQVTTAGNRPLVTQLETVLDVGEAEAIALAVERAPSVLLIDERDGRHMARTLGVPLTGTLGVLLRAKALGLVPAIKPLLTELVQPPISSNKFSRKQARHTEKPAGFRVVSSASAFWHFL
jgi:predicted nucleic acid-binding protein